MLQRLARVGAVQRVLAQQVANLALGVTLLGLTMALAIACLQTAVPVEDVLRDGGAISNIGILLWAGTTGVCALAALVLALCAAARKDMWTFAVAAAFSALLAADDMFQLHEFQLPNHGISENKVLAAYVLAALIYGAFAWRTIFVSAPWHLILTGALFATSLCADMIKHVVTGDTLAYVLAHNRLRFIIEDGSKLLGIGSWLTLHIRAALVRIDSEVKSERY
jgi:hypothetical protein